MGYEVPQGRVSPIAAAAEALLAARRVVLTTHVNADGDGIGSEVAVAAWLRALGAEAWIVNPTPYPDLFRFLLPDPAWLVDVRSDEAAALCSQADLAVVLDTGEISRLGRLWPMMRGLPAVVIDHHPPGDDPIGGVSLRDASACATGELVFDLIRSTKGPWPRAAIDGMYVAIMTDTGSFRFSNASPACHRVTAELIERGAEPEALYMQVYGTAPLRRFQLLSAALETIGTDAEGGVSWMQVPLSACQELGATPEDFEGLVDYPRAIEGTEIGILLRQTVNGDTKVSFRSTGGADVNALARRFGGGGHTKASGAVVKGPVDRVLPKVLDAARETVREARDKELVEEGVGS